MCPGEFRGLTAAPACDSTFRKRCYEAPSDVLATRRQCLQVRNQLALLARASSALVCGPCARLTTLLTRTSGRVSGAGQASRRCI